MIVPDVNVLVYAHREDASQHDRYADWLAGAAAGKEDVGLVEGVLIGFVRIVTHPRVFAEPATMAEALAFVTTLRDSGNARLLVATVATWEHFMDLAGTDRQVRGNLVPDCWIAAMARSHGARVATADRGFARFAGVRWFDPGAP